MCIRNLTRNVNERLLSFFEVFYIQETTYFTYKTDIYNYIKHRGLLISFIIRGLLMILNPQKVLNSGARWLGLTRIGRVLILGL